jgi:hypothetical protein
MVAVTLLRRNGGDESMKSTLSMLDAEEAVLLPEREELQVTTGPITVTLTKTITNTITLHKATVITHTSVNALNFGGVFGGNSQTAAAEANVMVTVTN